MGNLDQLGYVRQLLDRTKRNLPACPALLLCSAIAACSNSVDLPPMAPYVPPSAPAELVISNGVKQAVAEAKFLNPIEVTDLQPIDHGPGRFMLCLRGVSNDSRTSIYAVYFNEKNYAGERLPAILDGCERKDFHPFVPVAAPPPAKPGKART